MVNKVYNDLGDVLQTGWEAFLSYLLCVGPESLDKLFASVADKTQQQVYQEAENSIAKQVVSIAGQEHKANTVMSPLAKGAVAATLKHPNDNANYESPICDLHFLAQFLVTLLRGTRSNT